MKERFPITSNTLKRWFTEDELIQIINDYDAVIAGLDPFTERVIEKAERLEIIARRGIGYDNIDLGACKRKGIIVTNTPVHEEHQAVAEFTVALILDVTKNVTRSSNSLKKGSWAREVFIGRNVQGLIVGIIGLGNIGRIVARIMSAFGTRVIYYDPYVDSKEFKSVDLSELFALSDVISVHLPKTEQTTHLITSKYLNKMKQGSYLVDTSRSKVILHRDLMNAIKSGRIVSAAFDVFDEEPPLHEPLLGFENVVATPHIAGLTKESFGRIDDVCVSNVIKVLEEKGKPKFVVSA